MFSRIINLFFKNRFWKIFWQILLTVLIAVPLTLLIAKSTHWFDEKNRNDYTPTPNNQDLTFLSSKIETKDLPSISESDFMPTPNIQNPNSNYWHQNTNDTLNQTFPFLPKLDAPTWSYNSVWDPKIPLTDFYIKNYFHKWLRIITSSDIFNEENIPNQWRETQKKIGANFKKWEIDWEVLGNETIDFSTTNHTEITLDIVNRFYWYLTLHSITFKISFKRSFSKNFKTYPFTLYFDKKISKEVFEWNKMMSTKSNNKEELSYKSNLYYITFTHDWYNDKRRCPGDRKPGQGDNCPNEQMPRSKIDLGNSFSNHVSYNFTYNSQEENFYQYQIFSHIRNEHLTNGKNNINYFEIKVTFNFNIKDTDNASNSAQVWPFYTILKLNCEHTDYKLSKDGHYDLTNKQIL